MGQCRLLLLQDTSPLRKNMYDVSLMIVTIIEIAVYPYTRHG